MIIEIFGLPGSGKSHFAEKISKERAVPVIHIRGRIEKYALALLFAFAHPITFLFFLRILIAENKSHLALLHHKIRNLYFSVIAREEKAQLSGSGGIIDEGLVHFVLVLYEREISAQELEATLRHIPQKRHIYIVESGADIRNARMKKRKRVPREGFGLEYRSRWFPVFEHNYQRVKTLVQRTHSYTFLEN